MSAAQVSLGTLVVPPVPPPVPELPAGPVVDPPVPGPPPVAPPDELSPVLPPLELLPAFALLELPPAEAALCPPEPPGLADDEVSPAPPDSLPVRLGLAAQPTRAMAQVKMRS